jgi:hypothetical protein
MEVSISSTTGNDPGALGSALILVAVGVVLAVRIVPDHALWCAATSGETVGAV